MIVSHGISDVTVYARGALVTRRTASIEAPDGDVDVVLDGITPLAIPGSVRVRAEGGSRAVVSVHASLDVPEVRAVEGPPLAHISELSARRERLNAERSVLIERRSALGALAVKPDVTLADADGVPRDRVSDRFTDAIASLTFLVRVLGEADERIVALSTEIARLERELASLEVEARERSRTTDHIGLPTRRVRVRLGGSGPAGVLVVTYGVAAACWWPSHTLRLRAGGAKGDWLFEGVVCQATLEDWTDVRLALSSADMELDATLPALASLRFGRRQVREKGGYRRAPDGLEAMFAAFDRAFPTPPERHTSRRLAAQADFTPPPGGAGLYEEDDESTGVQALPRRRESVADYGPPPPQQALAPSAMPMPAAASFSMTRGAAKSAGLLAAGAAMVAAPAVLAAGAIGAAFGGGVDRDAPALDDAGEADLEPDDTWLDFDRLGLGPVDAPKRGRLALLGDFTGDRAAGAARRTEDAREYDFREKRGMYDHLYDAAQRATVSSDAKPRRLTVALADVGPKMLLRTVPLVEASVFREASIANPFEFPVLGGPAQVFVEGTLVAQTEIEHTDRGGAVIVACGTEERVKVVRNVRTSEESAGLLGGSLAVRHDVEIEVASALGHPIEVVVIDRVPISEEKAIEVDIDKVAARATAYDQADRGSPIAGGRAFRLTVAPGGTVKCALHYTLTFSSKLEIAGGNRRE